MEERKIKEIEHYDRLAKEWQTKQAGLPAMSQAGDVEGVDVMKMKSYQHLYETLKRYVSGKKVLDYGCGHGMHATEMAKMGAAEVTGIDLSEESLKIAGERAEKEGVSSLTKFAAMDAEHLEFPSDTFDVVFDGGAFSSIDINIALAEISRVLKPGGVLIGIETLGHHPLANLKRWLNKKRGIRTEWAADHIMKMKDFYTAEKYFSKSEIKYFHFAGLIGMALQNLPGGTIILNITEAIDSVLFALPFLRRYGFKAVFVLTK